jgi:basic amino acid/polyamine antiporter, APA family
MAIPEGSVSKAEGKMAPDEAASAASPSNLFVRKSSGLVRELGIRDAFAFNIGGVNPTGIGFFLFVILAGFPGADLTWPIIVAFVGSVLLVLMYSQLVSSMPRSGADFVYVSRILSPGLGSAVGLAFFIAVLIAAGAVDVEELARTYLPFVFQTLGSIFHSHALTTFATTLTDKGWIVGVSAVICLLTGWLMLKHVGIVARATYYAVGLGIVSVIVLILEFVFHSPGSFRHAFDAHVHNPHAYQQLVATAHKAGLSTGVKASAVVSCIALVNFLYGGATYANYTGGELRKPGWTFRASTILCLLVAMVLTLGAWLAMKHDLGLPFTQSAGWLSANEPAAYAKIAGNVTAYVPSYVLLIASNPVSKIVIAVGFASGVLSLIFAVGVLLTRLLFAMSFDRVLPTAVADVKPKSHAPVNAVVIVTALLFATTLLIVYTSVLEATRNLGLVIAGVFTISSFAATILPWRRRELYEMSAKPLGNKLLGLPTVSVIGALSTVYWAVALYLGATKTQVSGGYSTTSVLTLAGTCLIGVLAYAISRYSLGRKGLNLATAMHELPPE